MSKKDFSRREFLKSTAAAGMALLGSGGTLTVPSETKAAAGTPIPPITMTYYSNWQEVVEFFRKAATDLRKIGLTPNLNPAVNTTVTAKTFNEHNYGDWGSIVWGAIDYRLDPGFYLDELMHSSRAKPGGRNYGHYISSKFDAVCDAQSREMDRSKR